MGIGSNIYTTGMADANPFFGHGKPRMHKQLKPRMDSGAYRPVTYFAHGKPSMGIPYGYDNSDKYDINQPQAITDPVLKNVATQLQYVLMAVRQAGFPLNIEQFILIMAYGETGAFTSNAYKMDNNASGIKYLNKPYQDASRGIKSSEGDYYAHFANLGMWAKDLKRILSFGAKPIAATSLPDFVHRLKLNHYFGTTEAAYLKLLQGIAQRMRITSKLVDDVNAKFEAPLPMFNSPGDAIKNAAKSLIPPMPLWAKVGLSVAGLALIVGMVRR